MSTQPKSFLTPEQYLEIERKAEHRSEYCQGEMFAMSGASRVHNLLVGNTASEIRRQLRGKDCEVYSNDMRVLVPATAMYTYPDVVVVWGEPCFTDSQFDTLMNPILLVEALSPSTEAYDRGRKFDNYQSIASLQEYLLVSFDRMHADLFTRQPDGGWLLTSATGVDSMVTLRSIGSQLALRDLYEKVTLAPPSPHP